MNFTEKSQRSGLNRRPLGVPNDSFSRISRPHRTLHAAQFAVKSAVSGFSGLETVPKPFLAASTREVTQ